MGNPFKKVQPSQKLEIPAEAFNTFIDAALDFKARQRNQGQSPSPRFPNSTIVKVYNDSGGDRLRFEVLGLDAPIIDPEQNLQTFQNEPAFRGVKPQAADHRGKFAILLEPVAANAIAHSACVGGVTVAPVNVLDPEHRYADIARDTCEYLESCESGGAAILWKLQEEGVTWALVRLGNVADDICRFRLTDKLDRCGSASAERIICTQEQGSGSGFPGSPSWCQSDRDIEVVDSLGIVPPGGLSPGAFGWAKWMADSRSWEVLYYGEGCCGSSSSSSSSSSASSSSSSSRSSSSSSASDSSGSSGSRSSGSSGSSGSSVSESSISASSVSDSSQASQSSVSEASASLSWPSSGVSGSASSVSSESSLSQSSASASSGSSASESSQPSQSSAPSESAPSASAPPPSMPSESPSAESAPSGSAPSGSGPPSSAPSASAAPSSGVPSGSAPPSSGAPSGSAPPPSWGSDKSTAIIPASWTPGGYTALFTLESPEVLFEDLVLARIRQKATSLQIDPRFVEVCEPRSIVVSGCVPDVPIVVGASVEENLVHLRFAVENETQTVQLVLRLTGVRRGFAGLRFPNRSRRQFEANEAFINSAYPPE